MKWSAARSKIINIYFTYSEQRHHMYNWSITVDVTLQLYSTAVRIQTSESESNENF